MNPTRYYPTKSLRVLRTCFHLEQKLKLNSKFNSTKSTRMMVGRSLGMIWREVQNFPGTKELCEGSGL